MQPKIKPIDVTNAMFYWASLSEPNSFSKKFQVDVCQLSPEVIATLTALGVEIKDKEDERGKFVTAKNTNYPISAKMDGKELTKKVGNGSRGSTQLKPYYTKYGSVALNVNEITVKELNEYNPNREEVTVDDDPL